MLGARAVAPDELDDAAGERDEVALGRVEEVREAAAIAVVGEGQDAGDAVAIGLDVDVFVAMLHLTIVGSMPQGHEHQIAVVVVRQTRQRVVEAQPAQLVDLVVGLELAVEHVHAPVAHGLGASLGVGVLHRAELLAQGTAIAGLLAHLANGGVLPALALVELALGQRPVVVLGTVDERHLPVAHENASRRAHLSSQPRHGVDGIGSRRWAASCTSRSTLPIPTARSASTSASSTGRSSAGRALRSTTA